MLPVPSQRINQTFMTATMHVDDTTQIVTRVEAITVSELLSPRGLGIFHADKGQRLREICPQMRGTKSYNDR